MSEDIKGLIEKIQKEGLEAAQHKAREIESAADTKAASILGQARQEAQKIISRAEEEARKMQQSTEIGLKQAARDTLLAIRKEIDTMLKALVTAKVHEVLTSADLNQIILASIKEHIGKSKEDVILYVSADNAKKLDGLINDLKDKVKKNIIIRASDDVSAGFLISFDSGKSQFDFSDKALADYIGLYLKPRLNKILGEAVS